MTFVRFTRRRRFTFFKIIACLVLLAFVFWFLDYKLKKKFEAGDKTSSLSKLKNIANHRIPEYKALAPKIFKTSREDISKNSDKAPELSIKAPESNIKAPEFNIKAPFLVHSNEKKKSVRSSQISSQPHFNFTIPRLKARPGLGENGVAVHLLEWEQKLADKLFIQAAFNVYLSDRIALNRSVPDSRNPKCMHEVFDADLPSASVVLIFTNEIWSTLLRTIHSVINRTPPRLLREIILVDDFSDRDELKQYLPIYIKQQFKPNLVKLIRFDERKGLIQARLAGAELATGDVLIFLDSHCEANDQWAEPLLQRIKEERTAVLCPVIDVIDDKTFEYFANNQEYFQIGGFTWNGHFNWIEIPDREEERRKSEISPVRTPTMAGGLFAIEREYFWEIGSYDSGMEIWGGENLEMSFRVWMCGGTLEIVPCSHVGHVFRSFHPYKFPGNKDTHGINTVRTVEVWMDDFKKYFYYHRPDLKDIDYGDTSDRLELKKNLQCKPFEWYLREIYPEKFLFDRGVEAYGSLKNPMTRICLDTLGRDEDKTEPLGYYPCKAGSGVVVNQLISFTLSGELRIEDNCATVHDEVGQSSQNTVYMMRCNESNENQKWIHKKGGTIRHKKSGFCLDVYHKKKDEDAVVRKCHGGHSQVWWFEHYVQPGIKILNSAHDKSRLKISRMRGRR